MRENFIPSLGRSASVFGFGCASLGSRISERSSRQALDRAFDNGIAWFDVAPSYGDGQAERILGEFLRGKRDKVVVATKVGIAPPAQGGLKGLAKPAIRALINMAPSLRSAIAKRRPQAHKLLLSPALIEQSVTASLKTLRVDHVDVLALHEPAIADASRSEIYEALSRVVEKGYARASSIAGSLDEDLAFLEASPIFKLAQLPNDPFVANLTGLPNSLRSRVTTITHGIFGVSGAFDRLVAALSTDASLMAAFRGAGYGHSQSEIAEAYLLDYALTANNGGVCLLSMNRREHLASAVRASARSTSQVSLDLAKLLVPKPDSIT